MGKSTSPLVRSLRALATCHVWSVCLLAPLALVSTAYVLGHRGSGPADETAFEAESPAAHQHLDEVAKAVVDRALSSEQLAIATTVQAYAQQARERSARIQYDDAEDYFGDCEEDCLLSFADSSNPPTAVGDTGTGGSPDTTPIGSTSISRPVLVSSTLSAPGLSLWKRTGAASVFHETGLHVNLPADALDLPAPGTLPLGCATTGAYPSCVPLDYAPPTDVYNFTSATPESGLGAEARGLSSAVTAQLTTGSTRTEPLVSQSRRLLVPPAFASVPGPGVLSVLAPGLLALVLLARLRRRSNRTCAV